MKIHEKLKALRLYRGISQEIACIEYGVSRPTLSAIEKGTTQIGYGAIQNVATYYGCAPSDIMSTNNTVTITL